MGYDERYDCKENRGILFMKITKHQLRRIIKEEKAKILAEQAGPDDRLFDDDYLLGELEYLLDERGIDTMPAPEFAAFEAAAAEAIERLRREVVR